MSTLSACLIAKNEEKLLGNCLSSIKDVVDEILLVDTGSTDQTLAIAQSYGTKVFHTTWKNDFSAPRNLAIQHATMDWILVLDCDEMLMPEDGQKLKQFLTQELPFDVYNMPMNNWISGQVVSTALVTRLFRRQERFQFIGKIHEQLAPIALGQCHAGVLDIPLHHCGYDDSLSCQVTKNERNLAILLSYKKNQKDGFYYYNLANEYHRAKHYDQAIDCYQKSLSFSQSMPLKPIYVLYATIHLCITYLDQRRYTETLSLSTPLIKSYPDFKDLYMVQCLAHQGLCSYSEALLSLNHYINTTSMNPRYPCNLFQHIHVATLESHLKSQSLPYSDQSISHEIDRL